MTEELNVSLSRYYEPTLTYTCSFFFFRGHHYGTVGNCALFFTMCRTQTGYIYYLEENFWFLPRLLPSGYIFSWRKKKETY